MSDMKRHGASDKRVTEKHEANKHLINPCLCFYNQYRRFVGVSQPRYVLNQITIAIGIPNEIARITKAGTRSLIATPPLPIGQTLGTRPLQWLLHRVSRCVRVVYVVTFYQSLFVFL
jgi:hypothetical protein